MTGTNVVKAIQASAAGLAIFLAAGCGGQSLEAVPPESRQTVRTALEGYGIGPGAGEAEFLEGIAVVTTYGPDQAGLVRGQEFTLRPGAGELEATGRLPGGTWTAAVDLKGHWGSRLGLPGAWTSAVGISPVRAHGDAELSRDQKDRIEWYLRLMLHRLRGPLNLLDGGEKIESAADVFVATRPLHRIVTSGREGLASAYFFDRQEGRLALVTTGDYEAPGTGTVTIYHYLRTPEGRVLPERLEVLEMGANSFIGSRKVLTVRFEDLRVR